MLDVVVRKLIELGYERALRQSVARLVGAAGRATSCRTVWSTFGACSHARHARGPTSTSRSSRSPTRRRSARASRSSSSTPSWSRCSTSASCETVLAHEAAHILSDHVLYQTALLILLRLGGAGPAAAAGRAAAAGGRATRCCEWSRAAELSCDRAGDARHARPAGGLPHADDARRRRAGRAGSTSTRS